MRSTTTRILSAATLLALFACGDSRLDKLAIGMPKDSVKTVMAGPPNRTQTYMLNGKVWEFTLYQVPGTTPTTAKVTTSTGADSTVTDSLPWRKMSPVVTIDGKVVGWGWGWWDKESAKLGLGQLGQAPK